MMGLPARAIVVDLVPDQDVAEEVAYFDPTDHRLLLMAEKDSRFGASLVRKGLRPTVELNEKATLQQSYVGAAAALLLTSSYGKPPIEDLLDLASATNKDEASQRVEEAQARLPSLWGSLRPISNVEPLILEELEKAEVSGAGDDAVVRFFGRLLQGLSIELRRRGLAWFVRMWSRAK